MTKIAVAATAFSISVILMMILLISSCTADTTPPVITIDENLPTEMEVGEHVVIPDWTTYFTAHDDEDGDIEITNDHLSWKDGNTIDTTTVGQYVLVVTVSDSSKNTSSEELILYVKEDITAPSVSIYDGLPTTFEAGSEVPNWLDYFIISDNADEYNDITIEVNSSSFDINSVGEYTIFVSATDTSNNITTEELHTTVVDTTNPIIIVNPDNLPTTVGVNTTIPDWTTYFLITDNGYSNNELTISIDSTNFNINVLGEYTITIAVTDGSSNTTTEYLTISVVDTIAPVINIDSKLPTSLEANTTPPVWTEYITITDNYDTFNDLKVTIIDNSFDISVVGNYKVEIIVTDTSNNTSIDSVMISVSDSLGPIITVNPNNLSTEFEVGTSNPTWSNYFTIVDQNESTVNLTITFDDDHFDINTIGNYHLHVIATDSSGNSSSSYLDVTVVDKTAPTITVNPNSLITTFEINSTIPTLSSYFLVSDNYYSIEYIYITIDSNFDITKVGNYTVTITATDPSGNTSYETLSVEVEDTTKPVIVVNENDLPTTFEVNTSIPNWDDYFTYSDNSNEVYLVEIDSSQFNITNLGTYTITITVTDNYSNSTTSTLEVTVVDTTAPVIIVNPNSLPVSFEAGSSAPDWSTYFSVTDNYNLYTDLTITIDSSDFNNSTVGNYTIIITVTDTSNNSNSSYLLTSVSDSTGPTITINEELPTTFEVGSSNPDWHDYFTIVDNSQSSENINITFDSDSFDINTIGAYHLHVIATDSSGNSSSSYLDVTVVDTTSPTITINPSSLPTIFEVGTEEPDWSLYFTVSDNYYNNDDLTISIDTSKLFWYTLGTYEIIISVDDKSDNHSREILTISIVDTTAPVITINNDLPTEFEASPTHNVDFTDYFTVTDNYDTVTVNENILDLTTVNLQTEGTFTVTITASDTSGNTVTDSITFTIYPSVAPFISVNPEDLDTTFEYDEDKSEPDWTTYFTASDNFDGNYTIVEEMIDSSDVKWNTLGSYTIYIIVTDNIGNTSSESLNVMIQDTTKPAIYQNPDKTTSVPLGYSGDIPSLSEYFLVIDNYDGIIDPSTGVITWDGSTINFNEAGSYNMILTISDSSGNQSTHTTTITVEGDAIAPDITVNPNNLPTSFEAGIFTAEERNIDWTKYFTVIDNIDGVIDVTEDMLNLTNVDFTASGTFNIEITVKDHLNNSSSNSITITITEQVFPTITQLQDFVFEAGPYNHSDRNISCYDYFEVSDNNDILEYSCHFTSFDWNITGTTNDVVVFIAVDTAGNEVVSYFNVSLTVPTPPTLINYIDSSTHTEFIDGTVYDKYARLSTLDTDIQHCSYTFKNQTNDCHFPHTFSEIGTYSIYFIDEVGNEVTYTFEIIQTDDGFTSGQVNGGSYSESQVISFKGNEYESCDYWRNDKYQGDCSKGNVNVNQSGEYLFIIVHKESLKEEELFFKLDLGNSDYKFNIESSPYLEVNKVYEEYTLYLTSIMHEPDWMDLITVFNGRTVNSAKLADGQTFNGEGRYYVEYDGGKTGTIGYYINILEVPA